VIIINLYVDNIFVASNDLTLLKEIKGSIHNKNSHGCQGQNPYQSLHFTHVLDGLVIKYQNYILNVIFGIEYQYCDQTWPIL